MNGNKYGRLIPYRYNYGPCVIEYDPLTRERRVISIDTDPKNRADWLRELECRGYKVDAKS